MVVFRACSRYGMFSCCEREGTLVGGERDLRIGKNSTENALMSMLGYLCLLILKALQQVLQGNYKQHCILDTYM
jgi:hypothetical protein